MEGADGTDKITVCWADSIELIEPSDGVGLTRAWPPEGRTGTEPGNDFFLFDAGSMAAGSELGIGTFSKALYIRCIPCKQNIMWFHKVDKFLILLNFLYFKVW